MIQTLKKAIMTSISDVLETMFFMVLAFDETDSQEEFTSASGMEKMSCCLLEFKGSISGAFVTLIPESQLMSMAADFMGTDMDKITDTHMEGTIREVTNMIAGNTFSLYDNKSEFQLGIPGIVAPADIDSVIAEKGFDDVFIKARTSESFIFVKLMLR